MGEFELIRKLILPLAGETRSAAVLLGPGDDCAIQRLPAGHDLVFSVDTLVEGRHFPVGYHPRHLGWRSLAVAASDLAAMGAEPVCFSLALTLPESSQDWLGEFCQGLGEAARAFGLSLAGGDTTRGPLTLSLQVHGTVPAGQALRRSGAGVDQLICVSGTLGEAGAALDYLSVLQPSEPVRQLLTRYHRPQPRLALGQALRSRATAAIDVSDGLMADLEHILSASGIGADLDASALPISTALRELAGDRAVALALTAGDDYELCLTMAQDDWQQLPDAVQAELTVIGRTRAQAGIDVNGLPPGTTLPATGYDHFGAQP